MILSPLFFIYEAGDLHLQIQWQTTGIQTLPFKRIGLIYLNGADALPCRPW